MQTDNRILDDLSRAATGALSAFGAIRQEVEAQVQLVIVRGLATNTRAENERLAERLAVLESELKMLKGPPGGV